MYATSRLPTFTDVCTCDVNWKGCSRTDMTVVTHLFLQV